MRGAVTFLVLATIPWALLARAAEKQQKLKPAPIIPADVVQVCMGEPVLVDQAPPSVKGWGPYQCPGIFRLPSGEIGLSFTVGRDHYADHGLAGPLFVSHDDGATWRRSQWPQGIDGGILPILDGEYYRVVHGTGLKLDVGKLPKPVGFFGNMYGGFAVRRLDDCPQDVVRWFQDIRAMRWSPQTKTWSEEQIRWDHRGQLLWSYNDKPQGIPGDWSQKLILSGPIVPCGRELMFAEYWTLYETMSGKAPLGWECSLMVSPDNGRSWTRRSTIATASAGESMAEPILAKNQAGELVCVIRRDVGTLRPMYLVHSRDKGHTWTEPQTLFDFGVFPQLLQLENGVLILSFGRPGVWLSFSLDGGHSWTRKQAVIEGDPKACQKHSGGYTTLLALGKDTFLMTYDEFLRPNAKGQPCKSILVRRVTVHAAK